MPLDYALLGVLVLCFKRNNASYFIFLYVVIATHFSGKMSRLILICAPICSIVCAVWCGFVLDFILDPFFLFLGKQGFKAGVTNCANGANGANGASKDKAAAKANPKKGKAKASAQVDELAEWEDEYRPGGMAEVKRKMKSELLGNLPDEANAQYKSLRVSADTKPGWLLVRMSISALLVFYTLTMSPLPDKVNGFLGHCHQVARSLANPKVVFMTQHQGKRMLIDDYYKGYKWIDANTPKDARVIAWWDYGYQITGIAKRTSIADGNTWNHEHIATLGRTLTSPEKKAWNAIRHLADYVLVWAGGRGDDLAKSPHLARIGNSVFPEHCGDDDPKCNKFSFTGDGSPTPMMAESLLYKAVQHNMKPNVKLSKHLFKEVHTTKHGLMRVFKVLNISEESKEWISNPANRVCDAPGSWYCVGQYPPALAKLISKRRNFAQVEDFNQNGTKSAYTRMIEKEKEL